MGYEEASMPVELYPSLLSSWSSAVHGGVGRKKQGAGLSGFSSTLDARDAQERLEIV